MNYCRVCLFNNPQNELSQLTLENENDEKQGYVEIMEFCLGIQVTLDAKISTKLCETCYSKIIEFYQFKTLALRNDAHLRSVELDSGIKMEFTIAVDRSENENHQEDEPLVYVKEEFEQEHMSDDDFFDVVNDVQDGLVEYNEENVVVNTKVKGRLKTKGKQKIIKSRQKKPKKPKEKLDVSTESIKRICDMCGKKVKDLKQHLLRHKPAEDRQRVECDMCGNTFSTKPILKKHISRKHLNKTLAKKCHICGKSVQTLSTHIKQVHNPESLPFECVPCGRRFISKSSLSAHTTIHTKDTPFECEICGKRFRGKTALTTHIRSVHNKERSHVCQFCPKRYFQKQNLEIHMRSHTKERPVECPVCKKKFISRNSLRNHSYLHNTEKKYNCNLCDMSFISPNYLIMHMRSHTKDKKYPCQYCNVRFHRSDHRKRHEYTAHLKHSHQ